MTQASSHSSSSKLEQQFHKTLLQSEKLTNCLLKSNKTQKQDYLKIESQIQKTIDIFKKKFEQCQTNLQEIQIQYDKVKKFTNNGPGFLNAKLEEIKSKTKNLDQIVTGLKETVSKIKPQKLILLPVNKQKALENLFKTLFFVLYHKKQSEFEWQAFKKLALELEDGQDFISRLVNVHFKDFKPDQYEALLILKNDPQFDNIVVNSAYSHDIIDLADWFEYVCIGHKFEQERKAAEKAYDKIRRDIHRREGTSVEASKKFWKQALQQVDKFQMSLLSYDAQIKAFEILTQGQLDTIQERIETRNEQVKNLTQMCK